MKVQPIPVYVSSSSTPRPCPCPSREQTDSGQQMTAAGRTLVSPSDACDAIQSYRATQPESTKLRALPRTEGIMGKV
ncbi:hypothetical protein MHYP_G00132660 [Metynnis hypsauchen]